MKKMVFLLIVCFLFAACTKSSPADDKSVEYPKDPNITKSTCVSASESYGVPPAEDITDKCCEGFVAIFTGSDASSGYSSLICIYEDKCTDKNDKAEYEKGIQCCDNLVIMNDYCVEEDACDPDNDMILVSAPLSQKKCIAFPDCVKSGSINTRICEYCCVGSKYTTQMITGNDQPRYCLGPDEEPTEDMKKYGWSEPEVVTQEDFDKRKENCFD